MAVRPIDAVQVLNDINLHHRPTPVSEFESGFNNGLNQAMWEITHAPTLTQPNEWVSVEKRLPEDDAPAGRKQITVMVTTKAGKVTIASRVFEPERDYCGKVYPARWLWSRWLNNHVTHWMELPAPPGKDNNVPTKAQNEPLVTGFDVVDTKTGEYPDLEKIALKEDWAKHLMYCDMEGFAIEEDGTLLLLDECGRQACCPVGRFEIRRPPEGEEEEKHVIEITENL